MLSLLTNEWISEIRLDCTINVVVCNNNYCHNRNSTAHLTVETSCQTRLSMEIYAERLELRRNPQDFESMVIAFSHLCGCRTPRDNPASDVYVLASQN